MKKHGDFSGSLNFGILGFFAGKKVPGVIGFQGLKSKLSLAEAKSLSAAIGTLGSSGMFVLNSEEKVETIEFTDRDYEETISDLSQTEEGEAVIFGCPQMTLEELSDPKQCSSREALQEKMHRLLFINDVRKGKEKRLHGYHPVCWSNIC